MDLIADGLLIATALTATLYCLVLSRRLRRLTDSQSGIGAQIGELSRILDDTRSTVAETRRGLAESRSAARNANDLLMHEVGQAREMVAEIRKASAVGRRSREPVPAEPPAPRGNAGPDPDDLIPDWPDGLIDPPGGEDAAAAGPAPDADEAPVPAAAAPERASASGPIRVQRMAL